MTNEKARLTGLFWQRLTGQLPVSRSGLVFGLSAMLVIVVGLTMVGLWWGLGAAQERLQAVVDRHMKKIRLTVEMRSNARYRTRALQRMILIDDPFERDEEFMRFNSYAKHFVIARTAFLEFDLTPRERELLDEQGKITGQAVPLQNKIVDLVQYERMDEAKKVLMEGAIPTQDRVVAKLDELHAFQEKAAHTAISQAEKNYTNTRLLTIISSVCAGLLSLVVAGFVVRFNKEAQLREQYVRDIEKSKRVLEKSTHELHIAKEKAEEASLSKTYFLANMSHELRTPLNVIIGFADLMRADLKSANDPEKYEYCKNILSSGKHLLKMITDVLNVSSIDSGNTKVDAVEFELKAMVEGTISLIEPLLDKDKVQLQCQYDSEALGILNTDPVKLNDILYNLLANAAKFTKEGLISFNISTESDRAGDWLIFRVSDTGIGINQDELDTLFEPFTQADPSTTREYGGTGLGLTVTKRFCEMMGGMIEVNSQAGVGSEFIVRLPRKFRESLNKDADQKAS